MAAIKLELRDCLEDSPQTRALIGVFEQDTEVLLKYARGLQYIFQRISYAQSELTAATQALSQHLREFENQKFTLTTENDYISSTMSQLASKVDQVSSFNAVLQTQLVENSAYNSSRFVEKYLMEYENLRQQFRAQDKQHQEAMKKTSKLSKKRASESAWQEACDQLHAARKGFCTSSMYYSSTLNLLQSRKKTGLLEPLVSYIYAQMGFFKMGAEICQPELDEYLEQLNESLQDLEKDTLKTEKENNLLIDQIDAQSTRDYIPDPPPGMDFPELPIPTKLTQISGYLFARSHGMFMNQWNQRYYFTQGGNLMQQGRDEVAGGLVMDLDGSSSAPVEIDDRRYVFQVTSQDGKQSVFLQAESKHSCLTWVQTLTNISKGLYLANDPSKAAELMAAASHPAESTSNAPEKSAVKHDHKQVKHDQKPSKDQDRGVRSGSQTSSDFETKHEAFRPSAMFERLKNAATSLMTPKNESEKSGSRNPSGEGDAASRDTTDSELEAVVNSDFPILFDLPSAADHGKKEASQSLAKDRKPANVNNEAQENGKDLPSPQRANPFTSEPELANLNLSDVNSESESNFRAMYVVRFLGCKEVEPNLPSGYLTISNTIRAIMAARALHNVFSMNELHLVVTNNTIRLVDPATQLSRDTFPVQSILQAQNHRENPRLFGFIAKSPTNSGPDTNICYTFESNSDGGEVCCAIATAQVMIQSLIEHDEAERQRELESDLEEQSKLFTQAQQESAENLVEDDSTNLKAESAEAKVVKFEDEDLTMKDT